MANPSGTHQEPVQPSHASAYLDGGVAGNAIDGSSAPVPENSAAEPAPSLRHNLGLSMEWTAEEQSILEEGLNRYTSESNIIRYAKIAVRLPDKTVRDVALRCKWMAKKENSKRRKEEQNLLKKSKDKKVAARALYSTYVQQLMTKGSNDTISYKAIGGAMGQLLEQNTQAFEQITANFASFQIHENIVLFYQTRANILRILNDLSEAREVMKQMPPLPVRLNEELANSILPCTAVPMQS